MMKTTIEKGNWQFFEKMPSKIYMGIDCSSKAVHAGLISSTEKVIGQGKWSSTDKNFSTRFLEIMQNFSKDLSNIIHVEKAAVESAIFIQNPKSTIEIASVVAGVRLLCDQANIVCDPIDNRQWKKQILGKGNLGKPQIKEYTIATWGDIFAEQDWCDAGCIALWARRNKDE